MKCFVYRNLHRPSYTYSIKALEGEFYGKVVGHASKFTLVNTLLKVSQAGRNRTIQEKQRNVHAGVAGYLISAVDFTPRYPVSVLQTQNTFQLEGKEITYNPWTCTSFVIKHTHLPVYAAERVCFSGALVQAFGIVSQLVD